MKVYTLFSLIVLLMMGCARKKDDSSAFLSVSIEPQRYFVEKIVKGNFEVKSLVPNGVSPEAFDPAPSQILVFGQSKAYFKIGLFPFEEKWSDMLRNNSPEVVLVDCSQGVVDPQVEHEHHHHEHDSHHGHSHDYDPHIWSSPRTALAMSRNILAGVVAVDPANKTVYEQNFQLLEKEILQTDSVIRETLSQARIRTFIIYHPALSYFAADYDLEQLSVEHEGKSPSPAQMADLVSLAKSKGIRTVFVQPEFDKKNAAVLAKEIGGEIVEINPLEYNWKQEMIKIAEAIAKQ